MAISVDVPVSTIGHDNYYDGGGVDNEPSCQDTDQFWMP